MSEPKPDLNEYARTVLHTLAALSAEVYELKCLQAEVLAKLTSLPVEQIRHHYKDMVAKHTARLYEGYLEDTKIPPFPPDPPEFRFPGREVNPPE